MFTMKKEKHISFELDPEEIARVDENKGAVALDAAALHCVAGGFTACNAPFAASNALFVACNAPFVV